jgi:hypothetical protein
LRPLITAFLWWTEDAVLEYPGIFEMLFLSGIMKHRRDIPPYRRFLLRNILKFSGQF